MLGQYRDRQFETLRFLLFKSITSVASEIHTDGPVYGQVWVHVAARDLTAIATAGPPFVADTVIPVWKFFSSKAVPDPNRGSVASC
jgi:hypothetical protein